MSRNSPRPTTHTIASANAGNIEAHVFEPRCDDVRGSIVTVHPWGALGGGEHNTVGLARRIAAARRREGTDGAGGWRVVTFALRARHALWGIGTAHADEVRQTVDVARWAGARYGGAVVLLGSSAGAPVAGTAMARLARDAAAAADGDDQRRRRGIAAYVAVGYTFGHLARLGFGRHFAAVLGGGAAQASSPPSEEGAAAPPKLFVMGERDEFTSVEQLKRAARRMEAHGRVDVEIVPGVGHFELESSRYDPLVADLVLHWLGQVLA